MVILLDSGKPRPTFRAKSFDVEVFHGDQPVAFREPAAEVVMKGGTLVSDFALRLGHQRSGLARAVAAPLATGKAGGSITPGKIADIILVNGDPTIAPVRHLANW